MESRDTLLNDEVLAIGEVARRFGVSVDTVREWDGHTLKSFRTAGNQRRFRVSENPSLAALFQSSPAVDPERVA